MKTTTFEVDELDCTSCATTIEHELKKKGFDNVDIDIVNKTVSINYDDSKYSEKDLANVIKKAGFNAELI